MIRLNVSHTRALSLALVREILLRIAGRLRLMICVVLLVLLTFWGEMRSVLFVINRVMSGMALWGVKIPCILRLL